MSDQGQNPLNHVEVIARPSLRLGDLFQVQELQCAVELYDRTGSARDLEREVVKPAIERINSTTGQDNDTLYLAYVLEHAMLTIRKAKVKK